MSIKRLLCLLLSAALLLSAGVLPSFAQAEEVPIGVQFTGADWEKFMNIPVSQDDGKGGTTFEPEDEIAVEVDVWLPDSIEDWIPDFIEVFIVGGTSGSPGLIHFATDAPGNDYWMMPKEYLDAEVQKSYEPHYYYKTLTDTFTLPAATDAAMAASIEQKGFRIGMYSKYNNYYEKDQYPLQFFRLSVRNVTKDVVLCEVSGADLMDYAKAESLPVLLTDAIQPVVDQIAALPAEAELTLEHKTQVQEARAAVNGLDKLDRELVENLSALTAAEAKIQKLENDAADDATKAQNVSDLFAALPEAAAVTKDHTGQIEAAAAAYQGLSEAQKALVVGLERLTAAQEALALLDTEQPIGLKFEAIEWQKYGAIPVNRDLGEGKVAYDAGDEILFEAEVWLPEGIDDWIPDLMQFSFAAGLEIPGEGESNLMIHYSQDVETWIQAPAYNEADIEQNLESHYNYKLLSDSFVLPDADDPAMAEAIAKGGMRMVLMSKYNHLTSQPMFLYRISAYNMTKDVLLYEASGKDLMDYVFESSEPTPLYDTIQPIIDQIAALPSVDDITVDDKTKIEAARAAVDGLSEDDQGLVENLSLLVKAEAKLSQLTGGGDDDTDEKEAKKVSDLIDALPAVDDIVLSHKTQIEEADRAYQALTDAQKELVSASAVEKLNKAKERLAQLIDEDIDWGNVNGDDKIDATDALYVLQHTVELRTLTDEQKTVADVNQDSKINATDALYILQYLVNLIDRLPVGK